MDAYDEDCICGPLEDLTLNTLSESISRRVWLQEGDEADPPAAYERELDQ